MMKDEMNHPFVELQDICRFISGGTPSTKVPEYFMGTIPWITGADMNGNVITKARQYITEEAIQNSATSIVPKGNILLVTRTGVGKVAIAGVDICISQDFTGLEFDKTKIDEWYLLYCLRSQEEALTSQQRGATIQGITRDVVETIKLPLPPLTEQKRIASLLSRADRLRQLRRTAHELGDALLQSVFLEMFGDGSKFDKVEFEEILEESPKNGLYLSSDQYGSGTPIIRIDAFYDGVLGNPAFFKRLRATPKQIEEFNVQNDEILINRVNSLEYLGKCALVKGLLETTLFESNMMRIRINRKLANPVYVTKYLTTPEVYAQIMQKAKKAVNQASINQQDVKSIVIPVPPLNLQEEFAAIVSGRSAAAPVPSVESLRGRMGESERQVEGLFESLLAEAFA